MRPPPHGAPATGLGPGGAGSRGATLRPVATLTAVCVVHTLRPEHTNPDGLTAIDKRAVPGPVVVSPLGLAGDLQKDTRHHGGVDQALYLYADEDAATWAEELGREVTPGLFGENLRSSGLDVSGLQIGQRLVVGASGLVVEVTGPRTPCATFARRVGEERWVKRFTERRAPGAYLRVVSAGTVAAGDEVRPDGVPGHGVTVADALAPARPGAMAALLTAEARGEVVLGRAMGESARRAGPVG